MWMSIITENPNIKSLIRQRQKWWYTLFYQHIFLKINQSVSYMDIFPSFLPVLGHGVFHAIDSQYVLRLQTRHTSREVGMRTRTRSLSVVVIMLQFLNMPYFSLCYVIEYIYQYASNITCKAMHVHINFFMILIWCFILKFSNYFRWSYFL